METDQSGNVLLIDTNISALSVVQYERKSFKLCKKRMGLSNDQAISYDHDHIFL